MFYIACAEFEDFNFFVNFFGPVVAFLLWDPGGNVNWRSIAWREVLCILSQVKCEAAAAYWYLER